MVKELHNVAIRIESGKDALFAPIDHKICLLFVNYNSHGYLGYPVINDCKLFAENIRKNYGYKCWYVCNATRRHAAKLMKEFVSRENAKVVMFYAGHGAGIRDSNGDEKDGRDECFCFSDGYLVDDEFCDIINNNMKAKQLICITDACHSGTIYDIERIKPEIKSKMTCLSSCSDSQTSKQLEKNGMFSLQFWQCFNTRTKILDFEKINKRLDWFDQKVTMYPPNNYKIDF